MSLSIQGRSRVVPSMQELTCGWGLSPRMEEMLTFWLDASSFYTWTVDYMYVSMTCRGDFIDGQLCEECFCIVSEGDTKQKLHVRYLNCL